MTAALTATVDWPIIDYDDDTPYYRNSGEGGLMVYAVWPLYSLSAPSALAEVTLDFTEVLVAARGPLAEQIESRLRGDRLNSAVGSLESVNFQQRFSSAVLLASTGESICSDSGYFAVDRGELSAEGFTILKGLEALYGGEATLVTFLDT